MTYVSLNNISHISLLYCNYPGMIAEDGGEGSLEDFKDIKLTPSMDKIYQKAAPGSDLNLAKDEIAMFKKCKTHEEIENCLRQVLLDRFRAYKKVCVASCTET